jgi:GNAT superfamily N-acetyltransferase
MGTEEWIPIEVDPGQADRTFWDAYHAFRRRREQELHPGDPPALTDEQAEFQLKEQDPTHLRRGWVLISEEAGVISEFSIWVTKPEVPEHESSRHLLHADGAVLREYRRRGIGAMWARKALELMEEHAREVLSTRTGEAEGHTFLSWLGADCKQVMIENRLDFRQVDWGLVESWVEAGRRGSPGVALELYEDRIPDEMMEEYCLVFNALANSVPFDELDHDHLVLTPKVLKEQYRIFQEIGCLHHSLIGRSEDGRIIGLNDALYMSARPTYIYQNFAGLLPEWQGSGRGRSGLAKWGLAAMFQYYRSKYPETRWIITDNAASNKAALRINRHLGFKEYQTYGLYQISRQKLARKLGAVGQLR